MPLKEITSFMGQATCRSDLPGQDYRELEENGTDLFY
jgi:hypothetical protein